MELCDYIRQAAEKAGSISALSRALGINQPEVSKAANGRGRLPLDKVIQIADMIEADRIAVISANELVTEKKPEKRDFWSHLLASPSSASYIRHMMN